ncbi:MAG: DUF5686 family protein [Saprospiraceae bacterium]
MKNLQVSWLFVLLLLSGSNALAQKMTTVKGTVIDAKTNEPLPFVNVAFVGSNVGTTTDFDGKFLIETQYPTDSLQATYIGYQPQTFAVVKGQRNQVFTFKLGSTSLQLNTVEVKAKKERYRKKDNPAVTLIRNVIANKDKNRLAARDYYEYDKYEKVSIDLNNIDEKFRNRKIFNKVDFIFDYVDTSEVNGKPYLPVFLRETASKVYYRNQPEAEKEYREGIKITGIDEYLNNESVNTLTDLVYQDVNVYDDNMMVMYNQFVSPTNPIAVDYYRFYILDSLEYNGREVYNLSFFPRNKYDFAFQGNMYVTKDSSYAIMKTELNFLKETNVNFVNDLRLIQEFSEVDGYWLMTKDDLLVDYSLTPKGRGFFGRRTVDYGNHQFGIQRDNDIYEGPDNLVEAEDVYEQDEAFWDDNRPYELSEKEQGVYDMIDTLQNTPAFRNVMDIAFLFITGYREVGKVDVGPIGAFYSFNDVEGFRLRVGGKTNENFSEKVLLEGYAAYGFRDQRWKYSGAVTYTFNKYYKDNPRHFVRASYQHETNFVGLGVAFVNQDNFFLSFRRGPADRMLFNDNYKIDYLRETTYGFSYGFSFDWNKRRPLGSLEFKSFNEEGEAQFRSNIKATEFGINLRYAPNESYLQGEASRFSFYTKYPIIRANYNLGVSDFLGGDYDYHQLSLNASKRFYLSIFGFSDIEIEGGKTWGEGIPYLLLHLPRANPTYAYQPESYNMMNFLEFASDEYVTIKMQHYFNGLFFNRIPLLKRLKLREVISFKSIYGRLSDANNPNLNPALIQFISNDAGTPETYTLEDEPYMEFSAGIYNIFKVGRIDVIKRLTYLDNPNVPELFGGKGWGVRFRVEASF